MVLTNLRPLFAKFHYYLTTLDNDRLSISQTSYLEVK